MGTVVFRNIDGLDGIAQTRTPVPVVMTIVLMKAILYGIRRRREKRQTTRAQTSHAVDGFNDRILA